MELRRNIIVEGKIWGRRAAVMTSKQQRLSMGWFLLGKLFLTESSLCISVRNGCVARFDEGFLNFESQLLLFVGGNKYRDKLPKKLEVMESG